MIKDSPCPDPALLQRFVLGHVSGPEAAPLEGHLTHCDCCTQLVGTFHTPDNLLVALRAGPPPSGTGSALPAVTHLIRRMAALHPPDEERTQQAALDSTDPDGRDCVTERYPFLSAAKSPDELGWLGNYRVLGLLGSGGMGLVFRAEDSLLKRPVALKVMRAGTEVKVSARQRFLREARAAARVRHDRLVTIYQVGEENAVSFLAMELLEGETLEDRLKREGKQSPAEALRIAVEVAAGLVAAHANGLIHRDIKPGNIWLETSPENPSEESHVKILDFGLAHSQSDDVRLTREGAVLGTPAYMAPEQARGEAVDARADLFSLGVVLYVMLTGQRPFRGDNPLSVLSALALDNPPSPQSLMPDVPDAAGALTMRLLEKDPAKRPASASVVAEELRSLLRALEDRTTVLPPPVPQPPQPKPAAAPKRPRRGLLVALGVLFLGALVALGTWVIIKDKDGNIVGKMKIPKGGSAVVQEDDTKEGKAPKTPKTPRAKDKPFCLMRKGKQVEEFASLSEAIKATQQGDEIEIHDDGPFAVGNLGAVQDKDLILRAATGFRPRFHQSKDFDGYKPWLVVTTGSLRMEGVQWSGFGHFHTAGTHWFRVDAGECEIRRCRLLKWEGFLGILAFTGTKLSITDSVLVSQTAHAGIHLSDDGAGAAAEIRNCLFLSGVGNALLGVDPKDQKVRLVDNTVVVGGPAVYFLVGPRNRKPGAVDVEAEGNLFVVGWVFNFQDVGKPTRWSGKGNVYSIFHQLAKLDVKGEKTLNWEEWQKHWGKDESGGRLAEKPDWFRLIAPPLAIDAKAKNLEKGIALANELRKKYPKVGVDPKRLFPLAQCRASGWALRHRDSLDVTVRKRFSEDGNKTHSGQRQRDQAAGLTGRPGECLSCCD